MTVATVAIVVTTLQGCASYPEPQTPEEYAAALDRQAAFAARLYAAGAALRGGAAPAPSSSDGVRTYILNGQILTCTTSLGVTNCI